MFKYNLKDFILENENIARRLISLLEEGKLISSVTPCKEVWCKLLNVDKNNHSLMLRRLATAMDLPNQIIDEITFKFPKSKGKHTYWRQKVNYAFLNQNLSSQWSTFINHLDDHTYNYLEHSAELLDTKDNSKVVNKEELISIKENIRKVLDEIVKSELNEDFKLSLSKYLNTILNSIDEYNITGSAPIIESIKLMIGNTVFDEEFKNKMFKDELGRRVLNILHITASAFTVAQGYEALPNNFLGIPIK